MAYIRIYSARCTTNTASLHKARVVEVVYAESAASPN